jgi:hypothetical protein
LTLQLDYTECLEHENEKVKVSYPVINNISACPLCESRLRERKLEAQYERAMKAAHDLAELIVGKDR